MAHQIDSDIVYHFLLLRDRVQISLEIQGNTCMLIFDPIPL